MGDDETSGESSADQWLQDPLIGVPATSFTPVAEPAAEPNQSVDPNAGQPNQSVDPNEEQPNQCVDPNAGQPNQSIDPNEAKPLGADGTVTIPEVTVEGDANLGRAYDLGFADGLTGSPTHRGEIEQLAPGPTELLANYEQGFRDGQAKASDDDDGLPPGDTSGNVSDPEDEPWKGERGLTASERSQAQSIYQDSIDYDKVAIAAGSVGSAGSTRTIGNTIYMEDDEFQDNTSTLTPEGLNTLIHELGHVWQYQHGGLEYIPNALTAQAESTITTGDRNDAYNWRRAVGQQKEWKDWNAEQQAMAMEDYFKAEQRIKAAEAAGKSPALEDEQIVKTLEQYVSKVRSGKGAPGGPSDEPGDYVPPNGGDSAPA